VFGLVYGQAASYNSQAHIWRLPNGATVQLDQMESVIDFIDPASEILNYAA